MPVSVNRTMLLPMVGFLLASCNLSFPDHNEAWLVFDHHYKPLAYNTGQIPAEGFFDVHFEETANLRSSTDPSTLNTQNIVLTDGQTNQPIPIDLVVDYGGTGPDRYVKRLHIKSKQPLQYDHPYQLVAKKAIKTKEGNPMLRDEVLNFRTEKTPYVLGQSDNRLVTSNGLVTYQLKLHNTSMVAVPNVILATTCESDTLSFHAFVRQVPASSTLGVVLQPDKTFPGSGVDFAHCQPVQAFDLNAERVVVLGVVQ